MIVYQHTGNSKWKVSGLNEAWISSPAPLVARLFEPEDHAVVIVPARKREMLYLPAK